MVRASALKWPGVAFTIALMATACSSETTSDIAETTTPSGSQRAWADRINANGGLACRQVKTIKFDTPLKPNESADAQISVCENALVRLAKRAAVLFDERQVVRPRDRYPIIEAIGTEGHSLKACCRLLGVATRRAQAELNDMYRQRVNHEVVRVGGTSDPTGHDQSHLHEVA